jgi:hypothetical protein
MSVEKDKLAEVLVFESDGEERLSPARETSGSVDLDGSEGGSDVVGRGEGMGRWLASIVKAKGIGRAVRVKVAELLDGLLVHFGERAALWSCL